MIREPPVWVKLRERHARDHHIFTVRTYDVADPRNGREYVRTVIDAPDWVNVVATTTSGELIMVRQFRFGTWANGLEICGGVVDAGETPAQTAARELEEETGYRPGTLELIGVSHPNPAIQGNRLHSYRASDCVKVSEGRPDESEDLRVELISRGELRAAVRRGDITHALVLAALLYDALTSASATV